MALAALFNVPTKSEELNQWSFAHMASHRDIIRVIYEKGKIALPEYCLDPVNPDDTGTWTRLHQQMHADMNSALSLAGYNLLGLDWHDENKLAAWIQLNALEHRAASDLLKLG